MFELALSIAGIVAGVIVWGVRLEGQVNLQKQRVDDLKELINERFDGVDDKFEATEARLERIERSINGALGH